MANVENTDVVVGGNREIKNPKKGKNPMKRTLANLQSIAGRLGEPSKMPGYSYGLPALKSCPRGSVLATQKNTVCSKCYAIRGRYCWPVVKACQQRRLNSLIHPEWVEAMVAQINHYCKKKPYFRWHDSGDLLGIWHLLKIIEVANRTPKVKHLMPTREIDTVKAVSKRLVPNNLVIRISGDYIDEIPPDIGYLISSVHRKRPNGAKWCTARERDHKCGKCRACWNPNIKWIAYPLH